MLNVTQVSSLLQSLGVASSVANKAAERTVQAAEKDANSFLKELQQTLESMSTQESKTASTATAASASPIDQSSATATHSDEKTSTTITKAPFASFDEFRQWEKGLGDTFAPDYKAPDYIKIISLSLSGGDNDAFKRYVFFKNNPQYAEDYESIRNGNLSKFPTDGTTLVKSDLSKMDKGSAEYYKKNPKQLLAAEGFSMDPTLLKKRMDGNTEGISDPDWLANHRWTSDGVVASDNRVLYAQSAFIGLDGTGVNNYRLAKYNTVTGMLVDLDGRSYNPITGEPQA